MSFLLHVSAPCGREAAGGTPAVRGERQTFSTSLPTFSPDERVDMVEDDGVIRVTCEYCSRVYEIEPATV